ncbi:hypothetical protein MUN82_18495 [Hymenobacter aerilatus]|uniref:SH3 domain-containing protein n=1 Tax=Hymenobacter aerilatus TaxID=2932251 RepID=A0A8T9ST53_9BACT|nr:hypothetical protein [Hymenobacter aerilatus]UOR04917.1 hypothetical protein MUN82_18495 [Hymenobacter aerilatus]
MKKSVRVSFSSLLALTLLGSCNAAREDGRGNSHASKSPVERTAAVECVLYDGMTKDSPQLAEIKSGMQVQVLDSVDAYFVKARVSNGDKVVTGYMYRTCFPKQW